MYFLSDLENAVGSMRMQTPRRHQKRRTSFAQWTSIFAFAGEATSAGLVQVPSSSARICPSILSMTKREKGPRWTYMAVIRMTAGIAAGLCLPA